MNESDKRSPTEGIEKLSPDLRPIVDLELSLGNEIRFVLIEGWSNCPLAVTFERPLHFREVEAQLKLPESIETWENHDPHYEIEAGYQCSKTRHTLAGPIAKESKP